MFLFSAWELQKKNRRDGSPNSGMGSRSDSAPLAQVIPLRQSICTHCGNPITQHPVLPPFGAVGKIEGLDSASPVFCCRGCFTVYQWLETEGLSRFYDLKAMGCSLRPSVGAPDTTDQVAESFSHLDDPEFVKNYATRVSSGRVSEGQGQDLQQGLRMDFYLEGVHCTACVWLVEQLSRRLPFVRYSRLNLGSAVATIQIDESGSFSQVANEILKMGYRPHAVKRGEQSTIQKKENRLLLIRLGVAAACAGNIMLLAISLYLGADGRMAEHFKWLSAILYLPVVFFSAVPFYQSAWSALKQKTASIDIPVVFGLLLGSVTSYFNLATGHDEVYFDSLASLVFLLLSTRYLLKRIQQTSLSASSLLPYLTPFRARVWSSKVSSFSQVPVDQVRVGDRLQVLPGELIPTDGIVLAGESQINCSLLSGESELVSTRPGQIAFAGTMNVTEPFEIQVTQSGTQTRLGQILQSMEQVAGERAPISVLTDRISRVFVLLVLLLSVGVFFWHGVVTGTFGGWHEGLNRALAISIVTCPCTFALATPLVLSITLGKLARVGILVKGAEALERLSQVNTVLLDKTGTLTLAAQRSSGASRSDEIRPEARGVVQKLLRLGLQIWILSGDRSEAVKRAAACVGLDESRALSGVGPEDKRAFAAQHPRAMMVGDGANDALALAGAFVSVAVNSGVEISMRAADIYLTRPGIEPVPHLLVASRETLKIIRRNLAFSVIYNFIAAGAALAGKINPLFAAVLMPASALTVFLSSMAGTRRLRETIRLLS